MAKIKSREVSAGLGILVKRWEVVDKNGGRLAGPFGSKKTADEYLRKLNNTFVDLLASVLSNPSRRR